VSVHRMSVRVRIPRVLTVFVNPILTPDLPYCGIEFQEGDTTVPVKGRSEIESRQSFQIKLGGSLKTVYDTVKTVINPSRPASKPISFASKVSIEVVTWMIP
jgi:hypothetical protein